MLSGVGDEENVTFQRLVVAKTSRGQLNSGGIESGDGWMLRNSTKGYPVPCVSTAEPVGTRTSVIAADE